MEIYTEEDLKYAYEQGKLYSNICYRREFDNVMAIINIKKISDKEYKKLMKVINK